MNAGCNAEIRTFSNIGSGEDPECALLTFGSRAGHDGCWVGVDDCKSVGQWIPETGGIYVMIK